MTGQIVEGTVIDDSAEHRADDRQVEVRRNAGLSAVVASGAAAFAIAYLSRAIGSGAALDWLICAVLAMLAAAHLTALLDARAPLLVVDRHGVRRRKGRTWRGVAWPEVDLVEHHPRQGVRDGHLVIDSVHADPITVPLSLSTRLVGAGHAGLTEVLDRLADGHTEVVEVVGFAEEDEPEDLEPEDLEPDVLEPEVRDAETTDAAEDDAATDNFAAVVDEPAQDELYDREQDVELDEKPADDLDAGAEIKTQRAGFRDSQRWHLKRRLPQPESEPKKEPELATETDPEPVVPSPTPSALRGPLQAARLQISRRIMPPTDVPAPRSVTESTESTESTVRPIVQPIAQPGEAVDTIIIEDFVAEPAADPVIGPELRACRTRLGLSVDQVAERTRIRPHVIESIEVDDFAPCGGDFYARGHLRTLARILGADTVPLLATYDERYADAPIDPRRVFEAELATGANGSIRSTRGGPNWSVLVAAVMAVILVWSVARLVMDGPVPLDKAPMLNGSPGLQKDRPGAAPKVPMVLNAAGGGAKVVVRDGSGEIVFDSRLAFGQSTKLEVSPPARVWSSDGSVTATIDGSEPKPLGKIGEEAQKTLIVR